MSKDFDIRFTHALLMAIVILLTINNTGTIGGMIGQMLHGTLLILFCAAWAAFGLRLYGRKNNTSPV